MRMRINVYAVLGSVMGWFVIAYTFPPYTPTLNMMLGRSILGLIVTIFLGLLFGIYDDYIEAKRKNLKTLNGYSEAKRRYLKLTRKTALLREKIDKLKQEINGNGRFNTKK